MQYEKVHIKYLSLWQVPFSSCAVSVCIALLASAIQCAPCTGSALVGPGWYLWQCGPVFYYARHPSSTSQELGDFNLHNSHPFCLFPLYSSLVNTPFHYTESVFNCGLLIFVGCQFCQVPYLWVP